MKKRILSMILAIAMVASMFAGIAVTASAAEGNYVRTDALAVGDVVILATADGANVFTGIGGTAAKPIGSAVAATPVGDVLTSAEAAALTVEAGSVEGSMAFKMEDGTYLAAMGGNYLTAMEAVSDETSWIVTYEEGVVSVLNVKESTRKLQYNSGNPRFCAYESTQKPVAFYKLAGGEVCTHTETTSEILVAATCLEAGSEKITCTSCGASWEAEIPALGHTFNEGEITTAATCTSDGVKTVTCTVCGETATEVIEATGHDYVEGTCTVCGDVKSNVTFEKVANIVVGDQIVILTEKSGNELVSVGTSYGSGAAYAETGIAGTYVLSVVDGVAEGTFAFVNDGKYLAWKMGANSLVLSEELADLASWKVSFDENGNAVMINAADETRQLWWNNNNPRFACYADKSENDQYHTVQFYAVIEEGVCRHTEATGEITTAATCTEAGVMTYTCTCGYTWTEAIAALGHANDEGVVTTAATCTEAGVMTYTCTVCGATEEKAIPATGHDFVDGVCTACGEAKPETPMFELIDLETIVEGNYVITAVLGGEYPTVYPATSKITTGSNFDWGVSATAVTANENVISADNLPEDAVVFAFKGNNTDGFTISYVAEGVEKFLGYTTTDANRRLAFGEEYATTLWTVIADTDGGFALSSAFDGGNYVISQNSATAASAIRGYKSGTVYTGLYLFADAKGEAAPECQHTNTSEIAAVEATCTTDGNTAGVKCDDCGEIISGCETIKATGHQYNVTIADGMVTEECSVCGEKWVNPLNTIAEAKAYTEDTLYYNIVGVVSYISGRTVYIADENDGLCVYFHFDTDLSALALGDEIFVSAPMTTYKGLIEMDNPTEYILISTGNAVEAKVVDLATLAADTTNEYLGEKVLVEGAIITDIASNGTVTLDQNGTTIVIYKAPALTEDCVVGAKVNVTAIVSTYNGYQLLIQDAAAVVVVTDEPQPEEPTLVEGLKLNHTLNLASDISINYAVPMVTVAEYESYYVECIVPTYVGNELTGTTTVKIDAVENGFYYYFTLTGITAIQMNDVIEARLYMVKDGVTYVSPVDMYSVATYAYAQMNKTTVARELQCLCADLLRYGAAAQVFKAYRTDALADAAMTEAHKAFLSDIDAVTFNSNKGDLGDFENPSITWAGRALDLNSKVVVKFAFTVNDPTINVEDLSAKITYVNYNGETVTATVESAELYIAASNVYAFSFDQLLAAELRSVLNCVVYNGETRVSSTSFYSVDTYGNGKSGALLDVCKSLIAYSDTALVFFKSL